MEDHGKIELRSEKVRNIIGEIPPILVRSGIGIVFGLISLLLLATYFIPYPETLKVEITLKTDSAYPQEVYAEALVPFAYVHKLRKGMEANVEIDGYSRMEYGYIKSAVTHVGRQPVVRNDRNYLVAKLTLRDNKYAGLQAGMKGTAYVLLSDKTIWEHLFHP